MQWNSTMTGVPYSFNFELHPDMTPITQPSSNPQGGPSSSAREGSASVNDVSLFDPGEEVHVSGREQELLQGRRVLQDFSQCLLNIKLALIEDPALTSRDVNTEHVDTIYPGIASNGFQEAMGLISVAASPDEDNAKEPRVAICDGRITSPVVIVDGRHRRLVLRKLVAGSASAEWKQLASELPVTLWSRKDGSPISNLDILGLSAFLNDQSSNVRKPDFMDRTHASISAVKAIVAKRSDSRNEEVTAQYVATEMLRTGTLGTSDRGQVYRYAQLGLRFADDEQFYSRFIESARQCSRLNLTNVSSDVLHGLDKEGFQLGVEAICRRFELPLQGAFRNLRRPFYTCLKKMYELIQDAARRSQSPTVSLLRTMVSCDTSDELSLRESIHQQLLRFNVVQNQETSDHRRILALHRRISNIVSNIPQPDPPPCSKKQTSLRRGKKSYSRVSRTRKATPRRNGLRRATRNSTRNRNEDSDFDDPDVIQILPETNSEGRNSNPKENRRSRRRRIEDSDFDDPDVILVQPHNTSEVRNPNQNENGGSKRKRNDDSDFDDLDAIQVLPYATLDGQNVNQKESQGFIANRTTDNEVVAEGIEVEQEGESGNSQIEAESELTNAIPFISEGQNETNEPHKHDHDEPRTVEKLLTSVDAHNYSDSRDTAPLSAVASLIETCFNEATASAMRPGGIQGKKSQTYQLNHRKKLLTKQMSSKDMIIEITDSDPSKIPGKKSDGYEQGPDTSHRCSKRRKIVPEVEPYATQNIETLKGSISALSRLDKLQLMDDIGFWVVPADDNNNNSLNVVSFKYQRDFEDDMPAELPLNATDPLPYTGPDNPEWCPWSTAAPETWPRENPIVHSSPWLQTIFMPAEHHANVIMTNVSELRYNHHFVYWRASYNMLENESFATAKLDSSFGDPADMSQKEKKWTAAIMNDHLSLFYFGIKREEVVGKGFCVLEGFLNDADVPDKVGTRKIMKHGFDASFFTNLEAYVSQTFPGETNMSDTRKRIEWDTNTGGGGSEGEGHRNEKHSFYISSNYGITEAIERNEEKVWACRNRALLDARICQGFAALRLWDNNMEHEEKMFVPRTGGRWIMTTPKFVREPVHTDFGAISKHETNMGIGNPGYFAVCSGKAEVSIWVCLGSHKLVVAASKKQLRHLSHGTGLFLQRIPPYSIFIARGDLFHSEAGYDEICDGKQCLRYRIHFVPEEMSFSPSYNIREHFNPRPKPVYDSDSDEESVTRLLHSQGRGFSANQDRANSSQHSHEKESVLQRRGTMAGSSSCVEAVSSPVDHDSNDQNITFS